MLALTRVNPPHHVRQVLAPEAAFREGESGAFVRSEVGGDGSWSDVEDGDAERLQFHREDLGEGADGGFGRAVGAVPGSRTGRDDI